MSASLVLDVALVPAEADVTADVLVVIDQEFRASTTMTTLIDLGTVDVFLAGTVAGARRLARETASLLAGEYGARKPRGFDFDNSPTELSRADLRGRSVVLCTTNGTAVLHRVRAARRILIGCLANARACAEAALAEATEGGAPCDVARIPAAADADAIAAIPPGHRIQVVCAGRRGRFVLEDAVAAGAIVGRIADAARAAGRLLTLTDPATAALRLRAHEPDPVAAMADSQGGRTLREIGQPEDIEFCAREDSSATVPVVIPGPPMRVVARGGAVGRRSSEPG